MNKTEQPQTMTERAEPRSSGEIEPPSSLFGSPNQSPGFGSRSSKNFQHSVELHIEELVLHGFDPANRYAIGEAIERELARLFTELGAPTAITRDREIGHLGGSAFEISAGSNSETIGMQLAKAIYGGFGQ